MRGIGGQGWSGPRVEEGKKEIDSFFEGEVPLGHDEVDGVKVFVAPEAPGEVGLRVSGRVELVADGAEEAEEALGDLVRDEEHLGDDEVDRDVVSEAEECLPWDAVRHEGAFRG